MLQFVFADLLAIIFIGSGVTLCLVVAAQMLTKKDGTNLADRLLSALLICLGITLSNIMISVTGIAGQYNELYFLPINYSLSIPPLFFLFVSAKLRPDFQLKRKHLLHGVLPIIQFVFYAFIGFRDISYKGMIWREVVSPYVQYLESILFFLAMLTYAYQSYLLIIGYRFNDWEYPIFLWLKRFTIVFGILACVDFSYELIDWTLVGLYDFNLYNTSWLAFPLKISLASISIWVGINAYFYNHQSLVFKEEEGKPVIRSADHLEVVNRILEEQKPYLNPDFDLAMMSKLSGLTKNQVSQVINHRGANFNQVVNRLRIEAFKQNLATAAYENYSLLGVAFQSGFNSKATFNRVFKEITGQTPSQYYEDQKEVVSNVI